MGTREYSDGRDPDKFTFVVRACGHKSACDPTDLPLLVGVVLVAGFPLHFFQVNLVVANWVFNIESN